MSKPAKEMRLLVIPFPPRSIARVVEEWSQLRGVVALPGDETVIVLLPSDSPHAEYFDVFHARLDLRVDTYTGETEDRSE